MNCPDCTPEMPCVACWDAAIDAEPAVKRKPSYQYRNIYCRRSYAKHREERQAKRREYYWQNRERILENQRLSRLRAKQEAMV